MTLGTKIFEVMKNKFEETKFENTQVVNLTQRKRLFTHSELFHIS